MMRESDFHRDERYKEAIDRLNDALSATRSYVSDLNRGTCEDRKIEVSLSLKWYMASGSCSYFDRDFADRCFMKGAYWSEPSIWTPENIKETKIGLEEVSESIRQFLFERR